MQIYDISQEVFTCAVYPGDPKPEKQTLCSVAAGDSYNDLGLILNSKAGFLFKSTDKIKTDHPELPAYEEFDDLLNAGKN